MRCGGATESSANSQGNLVQRKGCDRREGESPLHYAHRPSQAGTDSGLHVRRQGVLDRQRQPELRLCKAAKPGSRTNLNLITASGNVYSFVLSEVTDAPDSEPDLKLFVEPKDESMLSAANGQPRFVTAQQVEDYRQQVEIAKTEARDAKQAAQTAIERETGQFRAEYPANLKFLYRFDTAKRPFNVSAMYTDGKFTYIQAHPEEPPALYELKDGKPNLIQFEFRNGTYVASKVLDSGYLAIGKQKLSFVRQESADK
jgi:Conjugal transfer protein